MSDFLYPLDTTGSALSNRVRGELQTLSPPVQSDNFHFLIPKAGPYYRDTMVITHVSTGRELIRGVDWEPGHYFHSASEETEHVQGGIYQSILFLDRTLSGQVSLDEYFVLGDHWSLDENKILEILSNKLWDPRIVTYELVSGKPDIFPPIAHMHPAGDLVGMREQVEATNQVSAAIREQTEELPGKLGLVLADYYTARDIDDLISGIADSLIESIAGPHLEAALRAIVSSMISNYYTKSEIDARLQTITNLINARYTNMQIDEKLLGKVDVEEYQTTIATFVTETLFQQTINGILNTQITQSHLDSLKNILDNVDIGLQNQINTMAATLDSLGLGVEGLLRADEFDPTLDASAITKAIRDSITDVNNALNAHVSATETRFEALETELAYKLEESDVYRILSTQTLNITDSIFPPCTVWGEEIDGEGNLVAVDYLTATFDWKVKDSPVPGSNSEMTITILRDSLIAYYHQGNLRTTILSAGTYDVEESISSLDDVNVVKFINLFVDQATGDITFNMTDSFSRAQLTSTPVYRWIRDGSITAPLATNAEYYELIEFTRNLTAGELTAASVEIELPSEFSSNILNVLHRLSLTCNGESIPVAGFEFIQEQGVSNKLIVKKPSLNISAVPAAQRFVELNAAVEIKINK